MSTGGLVASRGWSLHLQGMREPDHLPPTPMTPKARSLQDRNHPICHRGTHHRFLSASADPWTRKCLVLPYICAAQIANKEACRPSCSSTHTSLRDSAASARRVVSYATKHRWANLVRTRCEHAV